VEWWSKHASVDGMQACGMLLSCLDARTHSLRGQSRCLHTSRGHDISIPGDTCTSCRHSSAPPPFTWKPRTRAAVLKSSTVLLNSTTLMST
jgi:hypothetical protein